MLEPHPKRRIDDGTVLLGGDEVPVGRLVGAVFARIADECRRALDQRNAALVITVPAAWGPTRRHVIADAASAAGLGHPRFLSEPVAAAQHFLTQVELPDQAAILVYDLGGGTFDATAVRASASGFEVLSQDSMDFGGVDIDQALLEHLAATCEPEDLRWKGLPVDCTNHLADLPDEARRPKIAPWSFHQRHQTSADM